MAAARASSRWLVRAMRPGMVWAPWRSRESWGFTRRREALFDDADPDAGQGVGRLLAGAVKVVQGMGRCWRGSEGSAPAITSITRARSATRRAIGPTWSNVALMPMIPV